MCRGCDLKARFKVELKVMSKEAVEIIGGRERRRRWSLEEKLRIVHETQAPGECVRAVAARHDVDVSPNFPPLRSRALGCRHADRDGVSLFGRAAFLRPGLMRRGRRAQSGSSLAAGHRRSRRAAGLMRASTMAA